jgi:hypothetical protein
VICLDLIDNPVLTECSHIFCEECITEHLRHAQGAARVCPTCREPLVVGGTNVLSIACAPAILSVSLHRYLPCVPTFGLQRVSTKKARQHEQSAGL